MCKKDEVFLVLFELNIKLLYGRYPKTVSLFYSKRLEKNEGFTDGGEALHSCAFLDSVRKEKACP